MIVTKTTPGQETTLTQNSVGTTTVSISVCSSLISNPTYTPATQLPTDYTWGCPPGYLCRPPHTGDRAGCNVEAGVPADGYVCAPSDCIPAPPLIYNQSVATDENGHHFNISKDYYNLDPDDFGLDYSVFRVSGSAASKRKRDTKWSWGLLVGRNSKRDISDIPGQCYNDCNEASLMPQSLGKTPELCESDSFTAELGLCKTCINNNADSDSDDQYSQRMLPTFAQYLNYCSGLEMTSTSTTAGTTATSTTSSTEATTTSTQTTESTAAISTWTEETTSSVKATTNTALTAPAAGLSTSTVEVPRTESIRTPDESASTKGPMATGNVDSSSTTVSNSPSGTATPSASSPSSNLAASTMGVPRKGLLSLLLALFATPFF